MSYGYGRVEFRAESVDAFGRLRTSDLVSQFESKFSYGNEEKLYETVVVSGGTATFVPDKAAWSLATTTASGSKCTRETHRYMQYHPGKSQLVMMTGVFGSPIANCIKRIGYFDDNDGLYFTQVGTTGFGICRRTSTSGSVVNNIEYQSAWNLDKMDGTGDSGLTLDPTKTQILLIDFQWLGVGSVRFGVVINGALHYVHQLDHANLLTEVYMKSAWLPMRYEIENVGDTASPGSLTQICSQVSSESGMEERGIVRTTVSPAVVTITSGTWTPIMGIRVNTTLNSQVFRGVIRIAGIEAIVTGNNPVMFMLVEDPTTLTGASWGAVTAASPVQMDTSTTTLAGGSGRISFAGSSGKSGSSIGVPDDVIGESGSVFYLVGKGIGGASTAFCSINWREIL